MKYSIIFVVIFLSLKILTIIDATIINILTTTREQNYNFYYSFENEFNKYSLDNNLNITVKLTLLTNLNSTIMSVKSFGSMVETLLKKSSSKYDIYFYDNTYTPKYSPYLLDLAEYISEEELNEFNSEVVTKLCFHQNKLVGLVLF
ncbi:hypothetical protein H8356DRAFT_1683569 [Neocallimastix lanati (nom. inval.)]|uniref:Uncharacterized protein n=1 Tax=Neocallimastix californiae TaxID=1754190 RepID=A0A1Y2BY76_9FUNG|nr:hypothetical protein H8356DRAFT_1683569 [Neocallimastix sp. JGI-2020a]ORY39708.1 hypothetical protein LY90DRAFT_42121 [Neocallimastix californiae]|eukprot:ORY39708.1 hypothetical protein LY90DRAFT_42121 [Neocallimastix californiae]